MAKSNTVSQEKEIQKKDNWFYNKEAERRQELLLKKHGQPNWKQEMSDRNEIGN